MSRKDLVRKWDDKGFKLDKIENTLIRENTAQLLENQYTWINEANASLSTDIADFKKIVMPLTRRIFPNLLANEIVGVQPMAGPVGLAYALRFRYKNTGGADDMDEIGYNTVHPGYTGDGSTSGGGVTTSSGERWSSIDPTATQDIPESGLTIERVQVDAATRKLKARYSLEAMQDLKAMHDLDVESELVNMMQYEIAQEMDRELIARVTLAAQAGSTKAWVASAADTTSTIGEQAKFRDLVTTIHKSLNDIAIRTRRGPGNFIIASPNVITALKAVDAYVIAPPRVDVNFQLGVAKQGVMNGNIDVYMDTFYATNPFTNGADYVICGYKGAASNDNGIIFCPYIPVMISKAMEPGNFTPVVGVMSRYGIVSNLFGSNLYYSYISCDFSGIF